MKHPNDAIATEYLRHIRLGRQGNSHPPSSPIAYTHSDNRTHNAPRPRPGRCPPADTCSWLRIGCTRIGHRLRRVTGGATAWATLLPPPPGSFPETRSEPRADCLGPAGATARPGPGCATGAWRRRRQEGSHLRRAATGKCKAVKQPQDTGDAGTKHTTPEQYRDTDTRHLYENANTHGNKAAQRRSHYTQKAAPQLRRHTNTKHPVTATP